MIRDAKNDLKATIEAAAAVLEGKGEEHQQRKFVFHHMGNTDVSHDELKKKYKKKFGHTNNFDNHVSDYMG